MPFSPSVTPESVRALLGVDITDDQLPYETIRLPVYEGRAVLEVKRRDAGYADRAGDDQTRLNTAADHLCAAYIARKMPWLLGEDQGTAGGYRRQATDVDALIGELLSVASSEIEVVVGDAADEKPVFFSLASGTRGL